MRMSWFLWPDTMRLQKAKKATFFQIPAAKICTLVLTKLKIIFTGVDSDGETEGTRAPKIRKKLFFGQLSCKIRAFCCTTFGSGTDSASIFNWLLLLLLLLLLFFFLGSLFEMTIVVSNRIRMKFGTICSWSKCASIQRPLRLGCETKAGKNQTTVAKQNDRLGLHSCRVAIKHSSKHWRNASTCL